MSIDIAKKYVKTLSLPQREREEVENVIAGYIADCEAKDIHIDKLTGALEAIKRHQEIIGGSMHVASKTWHMANKALSDT